MSHIIFLYTIIRMNSTESNDSMNIHQTNMMEIIFMSLRNVAGWTASKQISEEKKKIEFFFSSLIWEEKQMKRILFLNLVLQWDYMFLLFQNREKTLFELRKKKTILSNENFFPCCKALFVMQRHLANFRFSTRKGSTFQGMWK